MGRGFPESWLSFLLSNKIATGTGRDDKEGKSTFTANDKQWIQSAKNALCN